MQRLAEQPLERRRVAVGRPQLELRVAARPDLQQGVLAAIVQLEPGDGLRVAAVEALGQTQDRRQRPDGPPALAAEVAVVVVAALGRGLPMVARDQRDGFDLVGLEAPQIAVLDQVVRVLVMALVADVDADVVQQRGVFEPLALAIGQPVDAARLIEQRDRPAARPAARAPASSCSARPARTTLRRRMSG